MYWWWNQDVTDHTLRNLVKDIRREQTLEKVNILKSNQKTLKCNRCCKNCPFNLKWPKEQLCELLGQEEGVKVFAHNLHWDHKNPLSKCRGVVNILNKEERMKVIAKCNLSCVFCHHWKTYMNGDTILGEPGQVERQQRLQKDLLL